jgi:prepilin signal peptidase PulO-like enzyme (type II secretory pathway)
LIVARKADRRTEIAFGPHMALGAVLVFAAPGVTGLMGLL